MNPLPRSELEACAENHPTPEQLAAYATGRLGKTEAEAIDRHLETCAGCFASMLKLPAGSLFSHLRKAGGPPAELPSVETIDIVEGSKPGETADYVAGSKTGATLLKTTDKLSPHGPDIAGHELLGLLGRGGMGVVYQARHRKLNRLVALKMILAGPHAGAEQLERFRREAQAVARLQHPNIVQIYEVGEQASGPFLSLEFVNGGSLAAYLRGMPVTAKEAARLVEQLARAMHAAHEQKIIHRDLKPANVLLASAGRPPHDGAPASGESRLPLAGFVPKISDFGLAKKLDEAGQTTTGAVVGTPSYMAPEQAQGKEVGPAADIYALGAILYELLTGRPPFRAATPMDTILQVIAEEPVPPSRLQPRVPRDLETICMKCLHKQPAQRYASAEVLAEDLRRFQAGEPILARPIGTVQRAVKWAKRRPALAALLGLGSVAVPIVIAALVGLGYQGRLAFANRQLDDANQGLKTVNTQLLTVNQNLEDANGKIAKAQAVTELLNVELQQQKATTQRLLYAQDMSEGARIWSEARPARLGMLLERTRPEKTGGVDLRGFEWHYLNRLHQSELRTIRLQQPIRCASFGSSAEIVAVAGDDALITLWDVSKPNDRQFLKLPGHNASVRSFAFNAFYDHCVSGGHDGKVILSEIGVPIRSHALDAEGDFVEAVAFTPDGNHLIAVSWANDDAKGKPGKGPTSWLQIWHVHTRKQTCFVELPKAGIVQSIACRPDGKLVALGDYTGRVTFADVPSGKTRGEFQAHEHPPNSNVRGLAFSPDGKQLASASSDRTVKIWDVSKVPAQPARLLHTLLGHKSFVTSVAFASDGQRIATGSDDSTVRVWDVNQGKMIRLFKGHTAEVYTVAFVNKGNQLLSAGQDKTVKIWDSTAYQEGLAIVNQHTHHLRSVTFTPDSKQFIAVGNDRQLWMRDAATGAVSRNFGQAAKSGYNSVASSPDGKRLLTGGQDGALRVWNVAESKEAFAFAGSSEIAAAAFLDDGQAVSANKDGKVAIWDLTTRKVVHTLTASDAPILCLACSRDGKHIAAGSADAVVRIWDASTGKLVHTLKKHLDWVSGVAFSPDGARLATASYDGTALLWDVATGRTVLEFDGHETQIHALAYSLDGKRIATGGFESIRLWDTTTGQETLTIRAHDQWIDGLAFSPDSRRLASAGWDQTVRVWDGAVRASAAAK